MSHLQWGIHGHFSKRWGWKSNYPTRPTRAQLAVICLLQFSSIHVAVESSSLFHHSLDSCYACFVKCFIDEWTDRSDRTSIGLVYHDIDVVEYRASDASNLLMTVPRQRFCCGSCPLSFLPILQFCWFIWYQLNIWLPFWDWLSTLVMFLDGFVSFPFDVVSLLWIVSICSWSLSVHDYLTHLSKS